VSKRAFEEREEAYIFLEKNIRELQETRRVKLKKYARRSDHCSTMMAWYEARIVPVYALKIFAGQVHLPKFTA
jgi:hypothetical protein